jgi:lipocalin-like protein
MKILYPTWLARGGSSPTRRARRPVKSGIRWASMSSASSSMMARGNMSGHVMRVDRPTFASDDSGSGTDAEVRVAFEGHVSYFGTYTIDPSARTVTHHVHGSSYPNWMGHDQIRYYRIDGSHLVLSTPPILFRGELLEYILTWERISMPTFAAP